MHRIAQPADTGCHQPPENAGAPRAMSAPAIADF